jgi:septal ring factor EnvC (AmiA/AmiB activator)
LKKRSKKTALKFGQFNNQSHPYKTPSQPAQSLCVTSASPLQTHKLPKVFWFFFSKKNCLALLCLFPLLGPAHAGPLDHKLAAARAAALQHREAAAAARRKAAVDASQAAALAQQQVAAATSLRQLEDQTATAAATLAALDLQSRAANQSLKQNEAALAALLPTMQRLSSAPAATLLAVPATPADAIRGILVLQGVAAEIADQAQAVHAQAQQVAILQAQTRSQQRVLTAAVASQTQAENALSVQIATAQSAETSDLDTAAQAAADALTATRNVHDLRSAIDHLQAKMRAEATARIPAVAVGVAAPAENVIAATGAPVAGSIVQAYGAPTVAGPAVGIVYRAAPGARVAAPCSGPVLYANPFQNYGLLVIMDCGKNYDAVLSGMRHLDVTAGQNLARGQPLGEMRGYDADHPAQQPMLYVELRKNGTPVDPTAWLSKGGSG